MQDGPGTPLGKRKIGNTSFEESQGQEDTQAHHGNQEHIHDTERTQLMDTDPLSNQGDNLTQIADQEHGNTRQEKETSYCEAASKAAREPDPKAPDIQYTTRRVNITIEIKMPKSAIERINLITEQINNFLKLARNNSTKHLRVIRFTETVNQTAQDRKKWLKNFKGQGSNHLVEYIHGFYPWQPLRDGAFRFRIFLAIPLQPEQTIDTFIKTMNNEWGDPQKSTVVDLLGQEIYSPKKMGFLLRSNRFMANTSDLQNELTEHASRTFPGLKLSLTFQSIPDPTGAKWHPDTAVKGIMVETNEDTYWEAWEALHKIYNKTNPHPPLGIHMGFVGLKDHPEFRGNPNVIANISVLMKRQLVFQNDTVITSTSKLRHIDEQIVGTKSLRTILMELNPTCSGPAVKQGRLFQSISRNINRSGVQEFHFAYNKSVAKEAGSVVAGICEFIRDELKIEPESCCYSHKIREDHVWDPLTRTTSNPDTEALENLLEGTKDLARALETRDKDSDINEDEKMDEDSKVLRERQRSMGITDDGETVQSMTKPKAYRKKVPQEIGSDQQSVTSGISGIMEYTSTSKASQERKSLRKSLARSEATTQKLLQELQRKDKERAREQAKLQELLSALTSASISPRTLEAVQGLANNQQSGESSTDTSRSHESQADPGKDDTAETGLRFKLSQNKLYPPQGQPRVDTGETGDKQQEADNSVESSSSDSSDAWGEKDFELGPPRSPKKTVRVNEYNPVDLTLTSTNEEDDSADSNGQGITQSEEESSVDSMSRGNAKDDNVFLDESDSSQDEIHHAKPKSVTSEMVDDAKRTISKHTSPQDATGGDTPGIYV